MSDKFTHDQMIDALGTDGFAHMKTAARALLWYWFEGQSADRLQEIDRLHDQGGELFVQVRLGRDGKPSTISALVEKKGRWRSKQVLLFSYTDPIESVH